MQDRLKLKGAKPSDEVETWRFEVTWKPQQGAMGVLLPPVDVGGDGLEIVRILTSTFSTLLIDWQSIGFGLLRL